MFLFYQLICYLYNYYSRRFAREYCVCVLHNNYVISKSFLIFFGCHWSSFWWSLLHIEDCTDKKTRNQQPRRGAVFNGSRSRPSLSSHEPTIYVSPSNLPPPPKYECLAPPSYEEVVGIHYPNYQAQQPIAQPIATALAQSTQPSTTAQDSGSDTRNNDTVVVTVNERPTVTNTWFY